ncbi:MAG: hypothetical protein K2P94_09415 [Rhodospirillaceae bacterium]|nr:hypothetical protein [Rhodospirillaceae bacterium]
MPKGEEKKGRDKKKPKQDKGGHAKPQSEYAKSMSSASTATTAFGPKKK